MKINWYMLLFFAGLVVLWLSPAVPYRNFYEGYGPQPKLTAQERTDIELKRDAYEVKRAYSDKMHFIGYTLTFAGIALTFVKIIADAVVERKRSGP